jgi:hypothetical protein
MKIPKILENISEISVRKLLKILKIHKNFCHVYLFIHLFANGLTPNLQFSNLDCKIGYKH